MKCQSKPSFRKLNAKEKEDVRQRAFGAGVAGASASASAHLSSPIASASSDTLHNNSFPISNNTTTIPSSQNNYNIAPYMGENKQRQFTESAISQTEQMERQIFFARLQQRQQLQMEMQHMNHMATDEALLTAQRYQQQTTATDTGIISTTTTSPITPEMLRRNIFSNEKNTRDT